jgi:ribosomal-protein-alanine N-acetyltransferase
MSSIREVKNWIRIRRGTADDVDALWELDKASFSLPWARADFEQDLTENVLSTYLIAESSGAVIGYAGIWVVQDECHIMTFAVADAWRKQGIASMIMNEMLAAARFAGATCYTLEVRASNVAAIALYEKFGFRSVAVRKAYYEDNKEDAVIMWKYDKEIMDAER